MTRTAVQQTTRPLKGRHVALIALGAFATILTANMALLFAATGSFPGLVVKNSYVAGVGWNERASAQAELGWTAQVHARGGYLHVALAGPDGAAVDGAALQARIWRASSAVEDRELVLIPGPAGYSAAVDLAPGLWQVALATAEGPSWRQSTSFIVREAD